MSSHPFVPTDIVLPGFQPMVVGFDVILGVFFAATAVVVMGTWISARQGYKLSVGDALVCCWLTFSGLTHILVEGPVVVNHEFYKDGSGNFVNDLWKEYSKADSRYLTRDPCTIGIEGITVFVEGPLCLLCFYGFLKKSSWRQLVTILTVCGELYGVVLYYFTSVVDDFKYQRPEPLYFWFYFWGMNFLWFLFPAIIIFYLGAQISSAVSIHDRQQAKRKKTA